MTPLERASVLKSIWSDAVAAVGGKSAVDTALRDHPMGRPKLILAVGKAASGMAEGALAHFPGTPTLVVTKYAHTTDALRAMANVEIIEAAHPVPDSESLRAGEALLDRVAALSVQDDVLFLVSGGASALAEALPDGETLDDLQALNASMLAEGMTIGEMNARRKSRSRIKDGKLIASTAARVSVLAISDVEGDGIATIGSGIGDPHRVPERASARVVASNRIARARAAESANNAGLNVHINSESLYADVFALAEELGVALRSAAPGVYIWGGEPTVVLPDNPGRGGRNQALALAVSEHLVGRSDISLLVAGTDGSDGPTDDAGGLVDGTTWRDESAPALARADAGTELDARGALFHSGPTHTNVMDLAIAIVSPPD